MSMALRGYDAWLQHGNPYDASAAVCMCNHYQDDHDEVVIHDGHGPDLTIVRCSVNGCYCDEFEEATAEAMRWADPRIP